MFETEENIPKESKLELEIYQPIDRYKRIIFSVPVLARIIWTRKIKKDNFQEGGNKYKVGVGFSKIKGEDRQRIIKYLENKL